LWRGNGVAGRGRAKAAQRGGGVDHKGPRGGGGGRVEPACGVEVAEWGAGALAARRSGAQAAFAEAELGSGAGGEATEWSLLRRCAWEDRGMWVMPDAGRRIDWGAVALSGVAESSVWPHMSAQTGSHGGVRLRSGFTTGSEWVLFHLFRSRD
jgi:hypothetical protein